MIKSITILIAALALSSCVVPSDYEVTVQADRPAYRHYNTPGPTVYFESRENYYRPYRPYKHKRHYRSWKHDD